MIKKYPNLDDAVNGVVAAAFGFQGQKCSACSRAIVDASVYDKFVEKLKAAVDQIQVGPAEENYRMGPVVSSGAEKSILSYIEVGKNEGRLLNGGLKAVGNGFYIKPTVICGC